MALRKQNLFMPVGGLQTDIDDKVLPLGRMIDLENCFAVRKGPVDGTIEAVKRFGFVALAAPGNTQGQLTTHLGALVDAGVPLKTLATPTDTTWRTAGGDFRPGISHVLTRVAANAMAPQMAIGGGYYWVIYSDAGTTLHVLALDATTGHQAFSNSFSAAGWLSWRVVYAAGRATFLMLSNAGTIFYDVVVPSTMAETITSSVAAASVASTDNNFDAYARDSVVAIAFRKNGSNNVAGIDFDPITSGTTAWDLADSGAAAVAVNNGALAWLYDYGGSGKVALLTANTAQGLRAQWDIPTTGATRQAASSYVVDAGFTANIGYLAGHTTAASLSGEFVLVYDTGTRIVRTASRIGGVVLNSPFVRNASMRSRTWQVGTDGFIVLGTPSSTNGAHYVMRILPTPISPQTATPLAIIGARQSNNTHGISSVAQVSAAEVAVALNYIVRLDNSNDPDAYGVQYATITHPSYPQTTLGVPRESIGSTLVPGAQIGQYDGSTFLEAGFAYPPESPAAPTPSVGGGLTVSSTYWYVLVYSYMDAQGRLWRSAPSVPASGATGAGDGTLTLACPTLRITGRAAPVIQIEAYRGAAGDEALFQKAGVVANDMTVDTVTFVDTMSDATLATKEFLYTNGGVLENSTPTGFVALAEAQNRSWGISMDDPQVLWPSKEHRLGTGVEWNEDISFDVRDASGSMRALAVIDDRPIVFKDDAVYAVGGQGPDGRGQGGSYAAQRICSGIGCDNPQAVCETRDGVIFRSTSQRAGFFLLDRGLTVTYIGAPVQRYNAETITSSRFLSSLLQARFYTASGRTLVYDLVTQAWSTFTGQPCASSTAWDGIAVYASSATSNILREDLTGAVLTDDGAATTMLVGWPWLQVNQIRGYERFYRQQITGEVSQDSVILRMNLYRNQETVPIATKGLTTPVGVINRELRYSAKLGALKVSVTDGGSTTGILRLTGVTLVLGAKAGLQRVSAANRVG